MGTIHFVSGLESLTLKALKDAEDCADILKDLGRIKYTIAHGSEQEAQQCAARAAAAAEAHRRRIPR